MKTLNFLTYFILLFMFIPSMLCGQNFSIFGTIKDSISGEVIPGVTISISSKKGEVISNNYGFYSIKTIKGKTKLVFTHISFGVLEKEIDINADIQLDILFPVSKKINLQEVVVSANREKLESPGMSRHDLKIETIKRIPSIAGEPDLLKSIQLLPGVNVVNEGSTNLNVRGGSFDQNLILLDEAPVFNPSHALGFFSTFNADALRNVSFYKAAFPAQYGGRLSSVLDIYMKEGSNKTESIEGGIGLLASRVLWQGPLRNEKSSFIISGRYSYIGHVVDGIGDLISKNFISKNDINFYDLNAKLNFSTGTKDHFYLSMYTGRDKFYSYPLDETNQLKWGNTTATFRWNHRFNADLFSNTSALFSNYNYSYFSLIDAKQFLWKSTIKVSGIKTDFDWFASNQHTVKAGFSVYYNIYQPGRIEQKNSSSVIREFTLDKKYSYDLSLYVSDKIKINDQFSAQVGIRVTKFLNIGPGKVYLYNNDMSAIIDSVSYQTGAIINNYGSFEPRVSVRWLVGSNSSFKLSYARTKQFLHLISNSTVGLPTDVWLPADRYIKPQQADQIAIGFIHLLAEKKTEISIELYYKKLKNIIDYIDNANLFLNSQLETQTLPGRGLSYGAELLVEKKSGKWTGWISYTWSSTKHQINGINNNKWFPAKYDINHNLTITGNYIKNKQWNFSATFRITSGPKITVPGGDFTYFGGAFNYYSDRNGYTLPVYHRLDFSVTHKSRLYDKQKIKREWVFSLFNVYNRYNIYALYIKPDPLLLDEAKAYNFYLHGIVPSVSLNFKL
ncbi:MAG: TonB-dependent receptor [Chitinophagaceae bacterium]